MNVRTVVVMWFAISCLMVTGPKEVSREHVVTVKLHQSFRGNEQTVYYLLNKCVHVASIKATRSHIRIEMEVAGDVVGCLDGCIALFTNYNPKFVHKDARTTLLSFYIPTHVNPHSESNGCRTDAKIYRKDADLLLDFYCSTEAPNKDDRSDWLLNMLSDDKNMHELFLSKEAIKHEEAKMGFKSDLLMQGGATRVRRSLHLSQSTVSNETIRLRNAVHWSEQFILGHFRWYVLVILAVFVFLLVATVIITCYFDCQNRRTRLPRASRHGRPVLTTSQASSHPLLSDDSTQESAPTPVERGSLKHRLMIEAHQSVSETSKSLTETNQMKMLGARQQLIEHMTPMESKASLSSAARDALEEIKIVKEKNVGSSKTATDQYSNPPLLATARAVDGDEETHLEAIQETPLSTPTSTPLQTPSRVTESDLKTAFGSTESETLEGESDDEPSLSKSITGR